MKHKENLFAGKVFTLTSAIGQGKLPHKGEVIESYGNICLVRETKAYVQGPFADYGIYKVMKDAHGDEFLDDLHVNYSNSTDSNAPHVYAAPETVVKEKFEILVGKMKIADSQADIVSDRRKRENAEKEATEKLKTENIQFIKERQLQINNQLKELFAGQTVKKLFADKKTRDLITDIAVLEKLKTLIR
jgi:hypothetical protein